MIVFEDTSFAYETGRPVIRGATFMLGPGLTLLLGPNGCGKSTLLKLAAGVERPDSGRILLNGLDLWGREVEARRDLAYLPEFPDITPYATVRDVLRLVCRLRGESWDAGRRALEQFGLAEEAGRSIRELSSGQRKRALFAAAVVGHPGHIFLDEPLDALDRQVADDVISWIGERAAAGATVVAVSHLIEPLAGIVRSALVVQDGKAILEEGLPAEAGARLGFLDRLARGKPSPAPAAGPAEAA